MINNSQEFKDKIKLQLDKISLAENKKIVFLPIGNVHFDDKYMSALIEEYKNNNFVTFNRKLNIYEINSVLANATAFIGTSLHGNIVSNSYGVPSIGINILNLVKLKNYFILLNREKYCVSDIESISSLYDVMMGEDSLNSLAKMFDQIDEHFDNVCKIVKDGTKKNAYLHEMLNNCYKHVDKLQNNLTVYYDCGDGYSENNKECIKYFGNVNEFAFSIDIPDNVKKIRIDPADNAGCIVKNLKIKDKENYLSVKTNADIALEDNKILVFFGNDSQIIVDLDANCKKVDIEFYLITAMSNTDLHIAFDDLSKVVFELKQKYSEAKSQIDKYKLLQSDKDDEIKSLKTKYDEITHKYSQLEVCNAGVSSAYNEIQNSFFWRITSPLRKISQATKNIVKRNKSLLKCAIFAKGFLRGGISGGRRQLNNYLNQIGGHRVRLSVISKKEKRQQKKHKFSKNIKFSVLVPLYNTPKNFLLEMVLVFLFYLSE